MHNELEPRLLARLLVWLDQFLRGELSIEQLCRAIAGTTSALEANAPARVANALGQMDSELEAARFLLSEGDLRLLVERMSLEIKTISGLIEDD